VKLAITVEAGVHAKLLRAAEARRRVADIERLLVAAGATLGVLAV